MNARLNPAPKGKTVIGQASDDALNGQLKYELQLVDVVLDGNKAWQMIQAENMFNEPAPTGMKYVMAKFRLKALQVQQGSFDVHPVEFQAVSQSGVIYQDVFYGVVPSPSFEASLYTSGENTGWVVFLVKQDDKPTIVWRQGYIDELWFTLN
ncbi:hypothetical protein [Bacillus songklensis]|uniref:hypothetical protein n=1 Tax=Bacillus songklensis TaxID=1069116 RepID=UPI00366B54D5